LEVGGWSRVSAIDTLALAVDPEMARMLDAAFALELTLGRKVMATDEEMVRGMRVEMDEATAAIKERQESSLPKA
jgi:hypothetical protein